MAGISAFGAYVPKYRLGPETLGWNARTGRAVANFDEDSVTMAVAAGMDCLKGHDPRSIDGLIFATTTPPYAEKQGASIVSAALDLRRDIFTADLTGSLRAGTTALKWALDTVLAGSARRALVVSADSRQGPPRGDTERSAGDGAAALVVSSEDWSENPAQGPLAVFEGSYSVTDDMLDTWRSAEDPFVRSWEDRFGTEEGLERIVEESTSGYFRQRHSGPQSVDKVALYAPDLRRHRQLALSLGFSGEQLQEPLFGALGNTGAAFPLMLLVGALEQARPEQSILVISYGDGCDVLEFKTTAAIDQRRAAGLGLAGHLESKELLGDYETYARWRDVWVTDASSRRPAAASPSVSALWRESDKNIRLYGGRCNVCGYLQYPPQRVCVNCQARDDAAPARLSDKSGTVFTYSLDYIAGATDSPLVVTVVDFEGGGRILCMMTDREVDEVKVGMPVEMSFRKLRVVNGIHNYYWKAVPRRGKI